MAFTRGSSTYLPVAFLPPASQSRKPDASQLYKSAREDAPAHNSCYQVSSCHFSKGKAEIYRSDSQQAFTHARLLICCPSVRRATRRDSDTYNLETERGESTPLLHQTIVAGSIQPPTQLINTKWERQALTPATAYSWLPMFLSASTSIEASTHHASCHTSETHAAIEDTEF